MGDVQDRTNQMDLTQSQLLLWMGQQLSPESPLYNMALTFDLRFSVEVSVFREAFQRLVQNCDSMRTVFVTVDEIPVQRILSNIVYQLEYLDFSQQPDKVSALSAWKKQRSQRQFDITKSSFDSVLIKITPEHFVWYLNQHHLITDAWGVTVQYRILSDFYQFLLTDNQTESTLPNPPQYADYVDFEIKERLENCENKATSYWQDKARKLPKPPVFFSQANIEMESHSERITVRLDKNKAEQLRALTMESDLRGWTQDLTLFNIFSTLLFSLVYRITGQEKLAIGTPAHNRSTADFKKTAGMFIKVFPLLTELSAADSFSTLFQKVRNETNEFLRYAQGGLSTSELNKSYNVILNYINASFGDFNGQSVQSEWIHADYADPGHHLRMQVYDFDASGAIDVSFDMNTAVFDEAARSFLPGQFMELMDLFLTDRFQSITTLGFTEKKLLVNFNNTAVDFPKNETVLDLFSAQVLAHPDKIAIAFKDQNWSYKTLDQKSNQLANYLTNKGVVSEELIAICLDRSLNMMLGLLGILKAGAAYVPIDPAYPEDRINYILKDAQTKFIICEKNTKALFHSAKNVTCILLDERESVLAGLSTEAPQIVPGPENLMYTIYTSGSTGRPKGVMNQHEGPLNRLRWGRQRYQLDPLEDVVLQKTTFCFDVSVWELFWPLITGVKLVFAEPEGHKDSDYLKRVINEQSITTIHFVPPMLEVFLLSLSPGDCPGLRRIFCSGEALLSSQVASLQKKLPHVDLHNLYGPTEAGIEVTSWDAPSDFDGGATVPIGKPTANTKLYILNDQLTQMPIGSPGQLHISGIQVARGYHRRPALTTEKFITNPVGQDTYRRMYKTGDLACWLPDGNIAFLGRMDQQVKIRGFRVELEEISAVIKEVAAVEQVVVTIHQNETGNKRLVAYIVTKTTVEESIIQAYLRTKVPEYMVPSIFISLSKLPLNTNGKIDRNALPAPNFNREKIEKIYVAPQTEIEELIHEIWSEVMQIEKIGIHDHFIELGGDSLTAIRAVIRINEAAELNLPINIIFQKNTIAQLAGYVEATIRKLLSEMEQSDS